MIEYEFKSKGFYTSQSIHLKFWLKAHNKVSGQQASEKNSTFGFSFLKLRDLKFEEKRA